MSKRFLFHSVLLGGLAFGSIGCGGGEPAIDDEAVPVEPIASETTVEATADSALPPPVLPPATDDAPAITPPAEEPLKPE